MLNTNLIELILGYNLSGGGKAYVQDVLTSLQITFSGIIWQFDLLLLKADADITIMALEKYLHSGIKVQTTSASAQETLDYIFKTAGI